MQEPSSLRATLALLLFLCASVVWEAGAPAAAQSDGTTDPAASTGTTPRMDNAAASPRYQSILDSLRTDSDSLFRWDEAAAQVGWADADTGLWRPDIDGIPSSRTKLASIGFVPELFRHTKVDGVTLGGGVNVRLFRGPSVRVVARGLRALSRGAWMGEVSAMWSPRRMKLEYPTALRSRLSGGGGERIGFPGLDSRSTAWALVGGGSDRSRVFGSERIYAGSIQSALAGVDGQSYLDRRQVYGGVLFQIPTSRFGPLLKTELLWSESRESALTVAHEPLFNTDPNLWPNAAAQGRTSGGLTLWSQWGNELTSFGTRVRARASTHGASVGAGAEVHTFGAEVLHRRTAWGAESVAIDLRGVAIGGGNLLSPQDTADLGGTATLRGFRPRSLVGATSLLGRLDYIWAYDPFRRWNVPLLRHLRLQPTLFVDAGAVWSPRISSGSGAREDAETTGLLDPTLYAWRDLSSLRGPTSADWRFDWGVGVQRSLGFPGLLGRARVDFGLRTDRSTDRLRVSVSLSP